MRISFINSRETEIFKIPVRYFQIGDTFITFGDEVSEGSHVEFQNNRLVVSQKEDNTWLVNLIGHSVFLTKGDILHKGVYNDKIDTLLRVPINAWALTYDNAYDEYTLFHFTPDGVEWEEGIRAEVAMSFYALDVSPELIEVRIEEGDE